MYGPRNGKQKWVSRRAKIMARWGMKCKATLDIEWRLVMEGFKNKQKYFEENSFLREASGAIGKQPILLFRYCFLIQLQESSDSDMTSSDNTHFAGLTPKSLPASCLLILAD